MRNPDYRRQDRRFSVTSRKNESAAAAEKSRRRGIDGGIDAPQVV